MMNDKQWKKEIPQLNLETQHRCVQSCRRRGGPAPACPFCGRPGRPGPACASKPTPDRPELKGSATPAPALCWTNRNCCVYPCSVRLTIAIEQKICLQIVKRKRSNVRIIIREAEDRTHWRDTRGKPANWREREENNHVLQTEPREAKQH